MAKLQPNVWWLTDMAEYCAQNDNEPMLVSRGQRDFAVYVEEVER